MCLHPIYGDICLYDKMSLNFGVTSKMCQIKTIWRNLIFLINFSIKTFSKEKKMAVSWYIRNGQSGLSVYREIPAPGEKQAMPVLKVKRSGCAIFYDWLNVECNSLEIIYRLSSNPVWKLCIVLHVWNLILQGIMGPQGMPGYPGPPGLVVCK